MLKLISFFLVFSFCSLPTQAKIPCIHWIKKLAPVISNPIPGLDRTNVYSTELSNIEKIHREWNEGFPLVQEFIFRTRAPSLDEAPSWLINRRLKSYVSILKQIEKFRRVELKSYLDLLSDLKRTQVVEPNPLNPQFPQLVWPERELLNQGASPGEVLDWLKKEKDRIEHQLRSDPNRRIPASYARFLKITGKYLGITAGIGMLLSVWSSTWTEVTSQIRVALSAEIRRLAMVPMAEQFRDSKFQYDRGTEGLPQMRQDYDAIAYSDQSQFTWNQEMGRTDHIYTASTIAVYNEALRRAKNENDQVTIWHHIYQLYYLRQAFPALFNHQLGKPSAALIEAMLEEYDPDKLIRNKIENGTFIEFFESLDFDNVSNTIE